MITFSMRQKVITRHFGFKMESGYCAPQPAVAEIIVLRELQRQTRVSSRREIGIRHERGWVLRGSLKKK